jgi:adhesin transport system outer membrane protein
MARRVAAQAASSIDLELTRARVQQAEVEQQGARSAMVLAIQKLEQLSGMEKLGLRLPHQPQVPDARALEALVQRLQQTDAQDWLVEQPAVRKAMQEKQAMAQKLEAKWAEQWPQVYFRIDQPLAKGSMYPGTQATYFLGLRYTPGIGFSGQMEAQALRARLQGADQSIALVKQDLQQALQTDQEMLQRSRFELQALSRGVAGYGAMVDSYRRQYQSGRKNWLDLLNVQREASQNEAALNDAEAAVTGAWLRLNVRMGWWAQSLGTP